MMKREVGIYIVIDEVTGAKVTDLISCVEGVALYSFDNMVKNLEKEEKMNYLAKTCSLYRLGILDDDFKIISSDKVKVCDALNVRDCISNFENLLNIGD